MSKVKGKHHVTSYPKWLKSFKYLSKLQSLKYLFELYKFHSRVSAKVS